jgi:alcohol dehydrogenase class IV
MANAIPNFEFATATRIIFGAGQAKSLDKLGAEFGKRALLVTGSQPERVEALRQQIEGAGISTVPFMVSGEPTIQLAIDGVATVHEQRCDLVISVGGGSVIDAGKAIAALASNPGNPLDYLEVIGKGQPLQNPPLPFIAVPTTAGTGAEVARNAVLSSPEHAVKVSLRSPLMLAKIALVDPELTYDLPPNITASTGMDALTQLIEPYVSVAANPLTDALCREGIARAGRSLKMAYEGGEEATAAREDMALASLFGGLALTNAKLGLVHGFAGPLGGMFPIPHGVACAVLLPHVMVANIAALRVREAENAFFARALERYTEIGHILIGSEESTAEAGAAWVSELCEALSIPSLSAYGIRSTDFASIVEKTENASSTKGNPLALSRDELFAILENATT